MACQILPVSLLWLEISTAYSNVGSAVLHMHDSMTYD